MERASDEFVMHGDDDEDDGEEEEDVDVEVGKRTRLRVRVREDSGSGVRGNVDRARTCGDAASPSCHDPISAMAHVPPAVEQEGLCV